ncbi:MAG: MBL fold metallo-hydrolase [Patescibacteria group bacterium]|nr:MBL fold metallo-hydrolase [Patescibacteria group bacterium]MDE2590105.1 MBL fold metallo-hydrolase [Patescibacteria group bacterium]
MKVSKHLHSCLLVKDQGKTVLIDPGNYSVEGGALTLEQITKLDALCITHEHMDHMYMPFIKQLIAKFTDLKIFGTNSIVNLLSKEGITASSHGNDVIKLASIPHEKIFMGPAPENNMVTLFDKFASPGDSLTFDSSPKILALPIQAPWGNTTWATETALKVNPKVIIPIHDWHWKDEVRIGMYNRLEQFFAQHNIRFLKPETGQVFDL